MKLRIKALSLALLSLVWMGHAQAQSSWSGSGCNSTSNTNGTCTISGQVGSLSGSGNLTIHSGGQVSATSGNAITTSGTFSITNQGKILASGATHGIQVNGSGSGTYSGAITNEAGALIVAQWNGISVEAGTASGEVSVSNVGTITATSGKGVYVNSANIKATINNSGSISATNTDSGRGIGIFVEKASSGSTVDSTGSISAHIGVAVGAAATVDSVKISAGKVTGSHRGLEISGAVKDITISQGVEVNGGVNGFLPSSQNSNNAGVAVLQKTVETLSNSGTIAGAAGVLISNSGQLTTLNNAGTIQGLASYASSSAITLVHYFTSVTLGTLNNQSGGVIESKYGGAIGLEFGTTIEKIVNAGTVTAAQNGLFYFDTGGTGSGARVGTIELKSGSHWTAGQNAFSFSLGKASSVGAIRVDSGSNVEAKSGAAFLFGSSTLVDGSGAESVQPDTKSEGYISIRGNVSSAKSTILNYGTIGETGHSGTVIFIGSDASIQHTTGDIVENNGIINGDIVFETNKDKSYSISNSGTVNGTLHVKGTGTVDVNDWSVTVSKDDQGQAKVDKVTIDVANGANVNINHVTINDIDSVVMGQNIDFTGAFTTSSGSDLVIKEDPSSVSVGSVPSSLGFDGAYDPDTQIFYTSFNIAQTAGAVVSQTLANQLMRRDFFLESAVTEAATGSLYHRRLEGVEGTVFVKPYASNDTFDLQGAKMDGDTQGVMAGINRFVGRHILTGFVGYERSEIDSNFRSSTMNLDVQTWYGGFNTAHLLQASPWVDTFLKGSLKASYTTTGIDRQILLNANTTGNDNTVGSQASVIQSNAQPNTVAVGMNVQVGMNFKPLKETQIIPMVGLGYSIGKTSSYQLDRTGLINDSYMPERVMMPYADASVTWFQGWGKIVRTFVGAGSRYILDRTQKTALSYGKLPIEGEYSLPQSFQYVNASMVLHVNAGSEIALGYTGVFDSTGHSQNLTAKYELHF